MSQISYRTVNFLDSIMYGIAANLGIDWEFDLLKDHARAWSSAIETRLRYAWELSTWPELQVTEERAFRQVWYSDVQYVASQGDNSEVYYAPNDTYYLARGHPTIGGLPTNTMGQTEDDGWSVLDFDNLDRHIAYDQYGKQAIGQILGVYSASPRTGIPVIQWRGQPGGFGLDTSLYTGTTVWLTYKPRQPKFTTNTYSTLVNYSRGDCVLELSSGDCYVALADGANHALNLASYWLRQEFPYIFSEYVCAAVSADMSDDVIQQRALMDEAETFLFREIDKNTEAGEVHYYGRNRSQFKLPLGTSGYYRSLYQYVT